MKKFSLSVLTVVLALMMLPLTGFAAEKGDKEAPKGSAAITMVTVKDGNLEMEYPEVHVSDARVAKTINKAIKNDVNNFAKAIKASNEIAPTIGKLTYEVELNDWYLLSMKVSRYTYHDRAAHGMTVVDGNTFSLLNGQLFTMKDFEDLSKVAMKNIDVYDVNHINRAIAVAAARGDIVLYPDFKGITEMPGQFYLDKDTNVHVLFQQYEIAPYSSGTIDINMN